MEKINPYIYTNRARLEQDVIALLQTFRVNPGETIKGLVMAMPGPNFERFKRDNNIAGSKILYNSISGLKILVIEFV